MDDRPTVFPAVGREAELSTLSHVFDEHGPRVCLVWGSPAWGSRGSWSASERTAPGVGIEVFTVDCRTIDPPNTDSWKAFAVRWV